MDRLRQSIRKSFRHRGSLSKTEALTPTTSTNNGANSSFRREKNSTFFQRSTKTTTISQQPTKTIKNGSKEKDYCQIDEAAVRSAACCFMVKVKKFFFEF